jgi:hypothetical protein
VRIPLQAAATFWWQRYRKLQHGAMNRLFSGCCRDGSVAGSLAAVPSRPAMMIQART